MGRSHSFLAPGVLVLAACGRIGFDDLSTSRDSSSSSLPCVSGAPITPVAVLNASLSGASDACSIDSVLVEDGNVAGLDRGAPLACGVLWDSAEGSCGCIAIDLGAVQPVGQVNVVAVGTADACGTPCTTACNSGDEFALLSGTTEGTYTPFAHTNIDTAGLALYSTSLGLPARYIVVCRVSWGAERDDVAIDLLQAICQ